MGATTSYGLKIDEKNENNEIAKELNINIQISYITQINGIDLTEITIKEFKDDTPVKQISVFNTVRTTDTKYDLKEITFAELNEVFKMTFGQIAKKDKLLLINKVDENSLAQKEGLKIGTQVVLGNDKKLMSLKGDIKSAIRTKTANFYVYDYMTDELRFINFENYREGGNLEVGFEVDQMNVQLIREALYEQQADKDDEEEEEMEIDTGYASSGNSDHINVNRNEYFREEFIYALSDHKANVGLFPTDKDYNYVARNKIGKMTDFSETTLQKGIYLD